MTDPITGLGAGRATGSAGAFGIGRAVPRGAKGPQFVPPDPAETASAAGLGAMSPVSLCTMLALQEIDFPSQRDGQARRHAEDILEELKHLQIGMLGDAGEPTDAQRWHRLAVLARSVPVASHPGLRAAVHSVALRAEIELARHGRLQAARAACAKARAG